MKGTLAVIGAVAALLVGGIAISHAHAREADHNAPQPVYSVVWRDGVVQALYGTADDADHCHEEGVVVEGGGSSFGVYRATRVEGETYLTVCGGPGHADLYSADPSVLGTKVTVNGRSFVVAK